MKNLFKAIADFQQEVEPIHKGSNGHGYSYADLEEVITKIKPLLKKHGLGFIQPINEGKLKTTIFHVESGETLESETTLHFEDLVYETVIKKDQKGNEYEKDIIKGFEGMNRAQAMGSLITYFRRYCLSSALGLITEKDSDGAGEKGDYKNKSQKSYPEDNRPWMSEAQFGKVKERIVGGDKPAFEAAIKAFRMKKEYRKVLEEMVNEL